MGVQGRAGQPGFSIIEKLCGGQFLESRRAKLVILMYVSIPRKQLIP